MTKRVGGLTGDTYGALVEITETVMLLVGILFIRYVHMGGTLGW